MSRVFYFLATDSEFILPDDLMPNFSVILQLILYSEIIIADRGGAKDTGL